jgi:hypothetical protein
VPNLQRAESVLLATQTALSIVPRDRQALGDIYGDIYVACARHLLREPL